MKIKIILVDGQTRTFERTKIFTSYTKAAEYFISNYHLVKGGIITNCGEWYFYDRTGLYKIFKRLGYYEGR